MMLPLTGFCGLQFQADLFERRMIVIVFHVFERSTQIALESTVSRKTVKGTRKANSSSLVVLMDDAK